MMHPAITLAYFYDIVYKVNYENSSCKIVLHFFGIVLSSARVIGLRFVVGYSYHLAHYRECLLLDAPLSSLKSIPWCCYLQIDP